jgi:hypothetical protein
VIFHELSIGQTRTLAIFRTLVGRGQERQSVATAIARSRQTTRLASEVSESTTSTAPF